MCGIAGFISDNPKYNAENIVKRMLDSMKHRGPDGHGFKQTGNITIGMVRLAIVDSKTHNIPMYDDKSERSIVFNGEIYNHKDLREELSGTVNFNTETDTETVLKYCNGRNIKDKFAKLEGMYAFAILDESIKTLLIVRDKSGEKPLYYCKGKDFFIFASEIKALLEFVVPEFNADAVSYKAYEFSVGSETLFKGIFSLEPGEFMEISEDLSKIKLKTYWKIWDNLIDLPHNYKKLKMRLEELLADAILLRTRNCAHRFGVFVGGGIDSSLIACIAKPDFLYTCHYDYDDFDELYYAKLVAKQLKKELIIVRPSPDDFLRTRDSIARYLDTPSTWTSFSLWMLNERAHRDIKVVMSGEGADEIFAGYHRYHLLHHDEQIRNMDAMRQYGYLINRYYGSPVERYVKLTNRCENMNSRVVLSFMRNLVGSYFRHFKNDIIHSMGLCDFYTTMQVLLQMSDRMSMAFSIENRSPFLDQRLIQFAFSMPSEFKIRHGITKWILKDIAKSIIPKEITERTDKRGLSAPVNKWFGWDSYGKYDRQSYKKMAFDDWSKAYL